MVKVWWSSLKRDNERGLNTGRVAAKHVKHLLFSSQIKQGSGDGGGRVGRAGGAEDGVLVVPRVSQDGEHSGRVSRRRELLDPGQPVLRAGVVVLRRVTVEVP
jgi:hypothetical protein